MIVDDLRKITFANLKSFGLLEKHTLRSCEMSWTSYRGKSSIGLSVDRVKNEMTLRYTLNESKDVKYKIRLVYYPSNLGFGEVGYFLCPITKKRCRTLYFVDGYFVSRYCFKGIYECQTYSKQYRAMKKMFDAVLYS